MHNNLDHARQNGKKWYVAYTKLRNEAAAEFHLRAKGIEVFYPKLFLPVPNKAGRQAVSLFPNYVFVHIDVTSPDYAQVIWCRGIKRLVSFGDTPSAVDEAVVDFLREQADSRGLIVAKSNLKVGDEVQINNGPFKGLVGIIQEPPDTKHRVKVLMAILSRHVQVEVPAGYIDSGWVALCPA